MAIDGVGKGAAVMLVVLVVVGVGAMYFMSEALANMEKDPRDLPHDYSVAGTLDGSPCTGTAHMSYTNESQVERVYVVDSTFKSSSASKTISFGIIFTKDDVPVPSLYTGGESAVVSGEDVNVWHQDNNGVHYDLYIGEKCKVLKMELTATDYSVTLMLES